ncbi:MAG TPA: mechanosensitive ion channel domain-containing protein [Candidatus Obscuribacterales bacterium]
MLTEMLGTEILSNTIASYLLAIAILIGGLLLTALIKAVVVQRLHRWSERRATDLDERLLRLVSRPVTYLLYLGSFYISIGNLVLHPILQSVIRVGCVVVATILVIQLLGSLVEYGLRLYWTTRRHDTALEQSLNALVPALKIAIWAIGLVFLLDNLGFDISAVVASLGIGGLAIAFAAQGILGDLFSYFSILFDRPFELGDFVIIGDLVGTVEHIGIKTTRLRSISGEQLVAANTDITGARIQNFKQMQRRRVVFTLGVTYETPQAKMQEIPGLIEAAIRAVEGITFDRAHFFSFGDFSLNYEVVYFVESADYMTYMNAQQQINLTLKAEFEARHIDFAYPTQLLYLTNLNGTPIAPGNGNGNGQTAVAVTSGQN